MRKKAFTLIELLVVISVMSLLMAIMVPVVAKARRQGDKMRCASNLRQMGIAVTVYANDNDDYFPMMLVTEIYGSLFKLRAWDFTTVYDSGQIYTEPGLLWEGGMMERIQQCPSFRGAANWMGDPYTGYNYNSSFIGGTAVVNNGQVVPGTVVMSSRVSEVKKPGRCAIFGDGQWSDGANKFMRSPLPGKLDAFFSGRYAGTQGYRHLGRTNVAYCDGSVRSVLECHKGPDPADVADGTGFLSEDNDAYDLK